jgi:hypothetical protein
LHPPLHPTAPPTASAPPLRLLCRGSDILPRPLGGAAAVICASNGAAAALEAAGSTADSADDIDQSAGEGAEWLRSGPTPPPLPPAAAAAAASAVPWPAQVAHLQLSSGELYEWGLMHKLLVSYTRLVQKTVTDLVPKAITHRLVDTTLHKLRHVT